MRLIWGGLAVVALALLGGFGAGVDKAPASAPSLHCNAAGYVADAVEAPSAAQLAAYAGRYQGSEGSYDAWGAFNRSGSAELLVGGDGLLSYNGAAYAITSACVDKAEGAHGKLLYIESGAGHFDLSDRTQAAAGQAWGVSPVDGITVFTHGRR